jgi:hypothetical protein
MQRAVGAGLFALITWVSLHLASSVWLCPPHRVWTAVRSGRSAIVVERGERRQRDGDAVWVCESPHRIGPFQLHLDLDCYCAPAAMTAASIESAVDGRCSIDDPLATTRRCSEARCNHYLD